MPRYLERPAQTTGSTYRSKDPRQTDLESYIAAKTPPVVAEPVQAVGSAGSPSGGLQEAQTGAGDALAEEVRRATGCGFLVLYGPPGSPPGERVCVRWDSLSRMRRDGATGSGRGGWFPDEASGLRHVIEYERISAEQGKDAAERFHATVKKGRSP